MLEERREWIHDFLNKREFKGLPKKAKEFYDVDKVAMPLSPEEEELKRVLEEVEKKEKKKKKDAKKAGKKGKKKKLSDREEFLKERACNGPSEAVLKIQEK